MADRNQTTDRHRPRGNSAAPKFVPNQPSSVQPPTGAVSQDQITRTHTVSAHVHVTPELLDDPAAFAAYVISELRRERMVLLSIIPDSP